MTVWTNVLMAADDIDLTSSWSCRSPPSFDSVTIHSRKLAVGSRSSSRSTTSAMCSNY